VLVFLGKKKASEKNTVPSFCVTKAETWRKEQCRYCSGVCTIPFVCSFHVGYVFHNSFFFWAYNVIFVHGIQFSLCSSRFHVQPSNYVILIYITPHIFNSCLRSCTSSMSRSSNNVS
jgi:hypothetical protein